MLKCWPIFLLLVLFSCNNNKTPDLKLAVAANAQFALREIADAFEQETGIAVGITAGSSGKLTAQIMQGAPFDVFVSADMEYPKYLKSKKNYPKDPQVYAIGQLLLCVNINSIAAEQGNRKVAIPNPKTAPYGRAALQYLQGSKDSVWLERLVFGESVGQVNQFMFAGTVAMAVTAASTKHLIDLEHWNVQIVNNKKQEPLLQGALVLNQNADALAFFNFLQSDISREIFIQYGYAVPSKHE